MELIFGFAYLCLYFMTRDGLCLVAAGLFAVAWEIWFCFHRTEDKNSI